MLLVIKLLIFLLLPSICFATSYSIQNGNLITVDGNGNLGVDNGSPGQALDVTGTIRLTGFNMPNSATNNYVLTSDGSGNGTWKASTGGGGSSGASFSASAAQGTIGFFDTQGTVNLIGGNTGFTYTGVNSTPGNVGIGSTVPGVPLDVKGTVRMTAFALPGNGASSGFILQTNGSTGIGTWVPEPTGGGSGANPGGSATNLQYQINGTTFGGITGTSVDANNNIGIGSATPGQLLDVKGTIRDTNLISSGNVSIGTTASSNFLNVGTANQFTVGSSGAVSAGSIGGSGNITSTNANVLMGGTSGTTGGTTFQGGANVIETVKFKTTTANGTTDAFQFLDGNNGGTMPMIVQDNSGINNIGIGTVNPIGILDVEGTINPVVFMADIPSSGTNQNVGIGSFSPGQLLDVQGTVRALAILASTTSSVLGNVTTNNVTLNNGSFVGGNSATAATHTTVQGSASATSFLTEKSTVSGSGTTDSIQFDVDNNVEAMRIQDNSGIGNIGIGSTNPGQALDVKGTIRALSAGSCTFLYQCNGGVDAGVIQTSACVLCPGGTCVQMNGCF